MAPNDWVQGGWGHTAGIYSVACICLYAVWKIKRPVCRVRWSSRAPGLWIRFFHSSVLDLFLKLDKVSLQNDLLIKESRQPSHSKKIHFNAKTKVLAPKLSVCYVHAQYYVEEKKQRTHWETQFLIKQSSLRNLENGEVTFSKVNE